MDDDPGGADEPTEYIYDDVDEPAPDLGPDELGAAIESALQTFLTLDAEPFGPLYDSLMAQADDSCPYSLLLNDGTLIVMMVLAGCSTEEPEEALPAMDPSQLLLRASLDLRGERPSAEEYARLDGNEDSLEGMLDDFVHHEGFGPRIEAMFAPRLGTRVDFFNLDVTDFGLLAEQAATFQRSVGDEALRILSEVATQDLPWTTVVTADWTMANEITGAIWPTDYPEGASGWQRVAWTDGRPAAGVLASNSL